MGFRNLKIRTRLTLGYGTVMAILLALLGLAIYDMNYIERRLEDILDDNVKKMELAQDMSEAVYVVSVEMRNLLLSENDQEIASDIKIIAAARNKYDTANAVLEKLPASAKGLEIRKKIKEAAVAARPLNDEIVELAKAHRDKEGIEQLRKRAGPATQAWQAAIDVEIEHQKQENAKVAKEVRRQYDRTLWVLGLLLLVGVVAVLLIVRLTTRSITVPLAAAAAVAELVAAGDLSREVHSQSSDELGRLLVLLEKMRSGLAMAVGEVRMGADNVSVAAQQIADGNSSLSGRTEAQASSVEETAASMEQITTTVKQNAENAQQANKLADMASDVAKRGGNAMVEVVSTIQRISASSKEISDIIGVIDSLAFQTNILALNAAVEAARAGEQGRGFAVVASEVRALAQRSAQAAKEIKTLIQESTQRVDDGVKQVVDAGETMREVVGVVDKVNELITEITRASREQLAGIEQVNQAIMQIDRNTQESAAVVEQAAAASEQMASQAVTLASAVARFKLGDTERAGDMGSASQPVKAKAKTDSAGRAPTVSTRLPARQSVRTALPDASGVTRTGMRGADDWKEF